jgi:TrmH family RNA methyltransferase
VDTLTLGKHNPRLADIRRAINGETLTDDGLLPVEGLKLIQEAQHSGLTVETLLVRSDVEPAKLNVSAPIYVLDQSAFRKIQTTENSQGVIALVRVKSASLSSLISNSASKGPLVVLSRLQDPGNTGTIIRVAESFGASGCIGLAETVGLYNAKAIRASAGSVFRLPCVWNIGIEELVAALREADVPLIGTSPHAKDAIGDWDWGGKSAVLIGNEGSGLGEDEIQHCHTVLRIPLCSPVESLNSAIAASVILYEAFKQRGTGEKR